MTSLLPYKSICKFNDPIKDQPISLIVPYKKSHEIIHEFTPDLKASLTKFLESSKAPDEKGTVRVYATREEDKVDYVFIALVSVGNASVEEVMVASAVGLKALRSLEVQNIVYGVGFMPEQMAIGGYLAGYNYDLLLAKRKPLISIKPCTPDKSFDEGCAKGYHQNFARFLSDTPANLMTPTLFVEYAKDFLQGKKLKIDVHDLKYIQEKGMGMFSSVTEGSSQPPQFLVITYQGKNDKGTDVSLVGKGVTFDSGGISLKPSKGMSNMKADMMGAASVLSAISLVCEFGVDKNVTCSIPLCENLPSGTASKPGDVRISMDKISVEIDNTDAEGRLILGDAMTHAQLESPRYMIDVATLTGAIVVSLGNVYMGLFSNDDDFANHIQKCGVSVYNEVWRMPLDKKYKTAMKSNVADIKNIGEGGGGSCTAAIFLNEFVKKDVKWAHLDIAGVMDTSYDKELYGKYMSGKPVCLLYEVILRL